MRSLTKYFGIFNSEIVNLNVCSITHKQELEFPVKKCKNFVYILIFLRIP